MKAFSLRVHFLGTNGWYDTVTGNTVCIALEHRDFVLVLDAGNGIQRLDSISVGDRPVFIFLSHLHLDHSITTLAIRLEMDGKVIAYCPDTGYCENAVKSARNADLLIAECALRSGEDIPDWPHLNPETAAQLAREAGVKQMALVHFDADRYRPLSERQEAQKEAQTIFPNVISACDGMCIELK